MDDSIKSAWKAFLRGIAVLLFGIAGVAFFFGGRFISEFGKTERVFAEMAGVFIAIVCGALGALAKSAGEEDEPIEDSTDQ